MPKEVKWAISLAWPARSCLWLGWKVYFVLVALHVVICLVLIGVILLQSGEAADLAGAFGGVGQPDGVWPARSDHVSVAAPPPGAPSCSCSRRWP